MANSERKIPESQPSERKAFEIIQKNFATAGITPNSADQSYPFNGTILFGFLLLGIDMYCMIVFLIYDAETFSECTQTAYTISILILIFSTLLSLILNVEKLFKFIDGANDLVNTSEWEIKNILQ